MKQLEVLNKDGEVTANISVGDGDQVRFNGEMITNPQAQKFSETVAVGDVFRWGEKNPDITISNIYGDQFACWWIDKDGRLHATDYLKSVLNGPVPVYIISRAADRPMHERIAIGQTVLRFPHSERAVDAIQPIKGDNANGYEASWGSCEEFYPLSDCEIVSGAR